MQGVGDDVRHRAFEQRRIGVHTRQRLGHVDQHLVPGVAEALERSRHHLVESDVPPDELERTRLETAHVEQVPDEVVESIGLLVDGLEQLVA